MAATRSRRPSARGYRAWPLPLAALRVAAADAGPRRAAGDPALTAALEAGLRRAAERRAVAPRLIVLPDVAEARARATARPTRPVPIP
ncbi:MAG: hypothetical protein JWM67_1117 [Mycobacterium sp.]|nr:hypothetical protein [Mycobacterium sp.]